MTFQWWNESIIYAKYVRLNKLEAAVDYVRVSPGEGRGDAINLFGGGVRAIRFSKSLPNFNPKFLIFHSLFQTQNQNTDL